MEPREMVHVASVENESKYRNASFAGVVFFLPAGICIPESDSYRSPRAPQISALGQPAFSKIATRDSSLALRSLAAAINLCSSREAFVVMSLFSPEAEVSEAI
jgi:hypothetical protein